jgi:transcriptional regulator of heat shock response
MGVLGILGPRRMEYGRMMALVESVARIVSETLAHMNVTLE